VSLPNANFDNVIWLFDGQEIGLAFDPAQYEPGDYTLIGEAVIAGCPADTTLAITLMALPSSEGLLNNYHICGDTLTFFWETDATTIEWIADENHTINYNNGEVMIVLDNYAIHPFEVNYSSSACTANAKFEVHNDEPIDLLDAGSDQVIAFGLEAQLNGTTTANSYEWTSADPTSTIDQAQELNTMITANGAGTYTYWLTASNGLCIAADTVVISFTGLIVPNTITPNGDQFNDTFAIPGDQVAPVWLRIVNRWGQVVYENNRYLNDWSGQTTEGAALPEDTYFYEFKVAEITQTGFIQIQR
jgi:gliding motility-associated-like protein